MSVYSSSYRTKEHRISAMLKKNYTGRLIGLYPISSSITITHFFV
nr:MAG TPA: hypothetical protein [Caudoviricetes sp.]DAV04016.1 MAG TPA: hypothetical protein [Caudoviricetes sp.]